MPPMNHTTKTIRTLKWALPLAATVVALGAGNASASTRYVDNTPRFETDCRSNPHRGSFATIQAAVNASTPDDTVVVCPGTYVEQVTITTRGLKLRSHEPLAATIQAPEFLTDTRTVVDIDGAISARVTEFVISGTGSGALRGVWVHGHARRTQIDHNRIVDVGRVDGFGVGIQFGADASEWGGFRAGGGAAKSNTISEYAASGIQVDGGSLVSLISNYINGTDTGPWDVPPDGPSSFVRRGIDLNSSVRAKVRHNTITGNNRVGIDVESDADTTTLTSNIITNNRHGMDVGAANVVVRENVVRQGHVGINVSTVATGNTYEGNTVLGHSGADCWDISNGAGTGGTANNWTDNIGAIASPDVICN